MARPALIPIRGIARLDVRPKSLLYYAEREVFAAKYYPSQYPNWERGPQMLRLVDAKNQRRTTFESGYVGLDYTAPQDLQAMARHMADVTSRFPHMVTTDAQPYRLGFRLVFATEDASFEELFPVFRKNSLKDEFSWTQLPDRELRDLMFNAYYGREDDGLNLTAGILTSEQAQQLLKETRFESDRPVPAIQSGALLVDLDRYVMTFDRKDTFERLFAEHTKLASLANLLADRVLDAGNGATKP